MTFFQSLFGRRKHTESHPPPDGTPEGAIELPDAPKATHVQWVKTSRESKDEIIAILDKYDDPRPHYNAGVSAYEAADYTKAISEFEKCLANYLIGDLAAYAITLCQKELDIPITLPQSFIGDRSAEIASAYIATNFVCSLLQRGNKAAYVNEGRLFLDKVTSEVKAVFDDSVYLFHITPVGGAFDLMVWRIDGDTCVPLNDPEHNPKTSETDKAVRSLTGTIPNTPMAKIPETGVPRQLR